MLALLSNEFVLGGIIIALVLGILIGKTVGFKKVFGWFRGSGERVQAAKAQTVKAEPAKATTAKAAK